MYDVSVMFWDRLNLDTYCQFYDSFLEMVLRVAKMLKLTNTSLLIDFEFERNGLKHAVPFTFHLKES